jgi:hypothetical protein
VSSPWQRQHELDIARVNVSLPEQDSERIGHDRWIRLHC